MEGRRSRKEDCLGGDKVVEFGDNFVVESHHFRVGVDGLLCGGCLGNGFGGASAARQGFYLRSHNIRKGFSEAARLTGYQSRSQYLIFTSTQSERLDSRPGYGQKNNPKHLQLIPTTAPSIDEMPPDRDTSDILTPTPYSEFIKLEEHLKTWYDAISPRYVDLVSDFAGQEFFLLDGEALVQSIFNDRMLDLAGSKGGIHLIPLTFYLF